MTAFLDTNVIAYQYDDSVPDKQGRAREVFLEQAPDAVISTHVLIEPHAVLTKKLGHTRATAERVLGALDVDVVPTDATLVRRAASTATNHQLSIFDALIVEAASLAGCQVLDSEDLADGATVRGVRIVNPFLDLGDAATDRA